jgi:Fe-S-cluster containining protein
MVRDTKALADADALLLRVIGATCEEAKRRAGEHLVCHAGCFSCCYGPFPITQLDAWRIRRGLEEMQRTDAASAAAIVGRARAAEAKLLERFPGDAETGEIDEAEGWLPFEYVERHNMVPCPALDSETGACQIYSHRPIACRTLGPPSVIDGKTLQHCRLCFQEATEEQIETGRVTFDDGAAGGAAAEELERCYTPRGRTLIAIALSGLRYRF